MTTQRLEAEARAAAPVKPWTPAPLRPPPHPTVAALREEAETVRVEGEKIKARAASMSIEAGRIGQRISSLETERTALQQRLANLPGDLKALRESARADVHRLYGVHNLDANQQITLNGACLALVWSKEVEKELPIIRKDLQARLEETEKELASLTAPK